MKQTLTGYLKTVTDPGDLPKVGSALSETWRYYQVHFRDLMRLSLISIVGVAFTLPGLLMSVVGVDKSGSLVTAQPTDFGTHFSLTAIGALIMILASIFVRTGLNASIFGGIHDKRLSTRAALLHGLKVFWPYVLTAIIFALVTGFWFSLPFSPILVIIPCLIIAAYLVFAEQATVIEELKWLDPFRRSLHLVVGRFWPVFWRLLACYVAYGLLIVVTSGVLVQLPLSLVTNLLALDPLALRVSLVPLMLLGGLVTSLITPLPIIFQVQLYDRLKHLAK
jgi:hypothetical protein